MNKHLPFLAASAALLLLGAGCMAVEPKPQGAPGAVEPAPSEAPAQSATAPAEVGTGELHVSWSAPQPADPPDVFAESYKKWNPYGDASSTAVAEYLKPEHYRQVGVVKDGAYAGGKVLIVDASMLCTMGGYDQHYHFVLPVSGKPVLLARLSPAYDVSDGDPNDPNCRTFDYGKFVVDTSADAPELRLPEKLSHAGSDFKLVQSSYYFSQDLQIGTPLYDPAGKKPAFTDPGVGEVTTDAEGVQFPLYGFYAVAPDGTVRTYALVVPFYDENLHVPAVTWADGTKNDKEYWLTKMGGCGQQGFANVFENVSKSELKAAGTASGGDTIYLLKDPNHKILKDIYAAYAPPDWPVAEGMPARATYDEVVKSKPIFFWYDPFGRLIGFQGTQFMSAAECGKPVIYLYPPKTEDVSVKLDPQGGFTKSEPSYNEGWNVRATPEGELTDLSDGKAYPYLFWEGRGGLYRTPEQGWSVAQKDVHGFLIEKLSELGLNAKESADFMEFWEPRMQGSPWYFVTFLGNQAMDALAPMSVAPQPDHVIRILMDFHPTSAPEAVQGFDIHTPTRDGFTVVEWGGVLR